MNKFDENPKFENILNPEIQNLAKSQNLKSLTLKSKIFNFDKIGQFSRKFFEPTPQQALRERQKDHPRDTIVDVVQTRPIFHAPDAPGGGQDHVAQRQLLVKGLLGVINRRQKPIQILDRDGALQLEIGERPTADAHEQINAGLIKRERSVKALIIRAVGGEH